MTSSQPSQATTFDWLSVPLVATLAALTAAFAIPLGQLVKLATSSDLYSHTLLIPAVTLYLAWDNRKQLQPSPPLPALALLPALLGGLGLWAFFGSESAASAEGLERYAALATFAYVSFVLAACFFFLGRQTIKANLFPLLFLYATCPFTPGIREGIETFFQYTSAETAYWFINWSGIPIFREGLTFHMPTISMRVAPECSGIRSSLVLFIVSLVGSYLLLKTTWKRSLLVLLVIPLGIFRNAIRILILAQLCYQIDPEMINSWFHHSGGPPLFAITLIPFFLILYWLRKSENKPRTTQDAKGSET